MTYVAQFSRRFPDLVCVYICIFLYLLNFFLSLNQPFGSINKEHGELLRWLADTRQRLTLVIEAPIRDIQAEYRVTTHFVFVFFVHYSQRRERKMVGSISKRKKNY
jgi:hypothetical protein